MKTNRINRLDTKHGRRLTMLLFIIGCFTLPQAVYASTATGTVTKVLVGRLGTEVYIDMTGVSSIACSATHPSGFDYMFELDTHGAAQEMLSAIYLAMASGKSLTVIGTSQCASSGNLEIVSYIQLAS